LTLSGANAYGGNTNINAGTLRLAGDNRLPPATQVSLANAAGVMLDLDGRSQTITKLVGGGASGGNISLGSGGTLTIDLNLPSNLTYAGVISGSGRLVIQRGVGSQTLTGASTYTGSTVINSGGLHLSGGNNRLPTTTALTLANTSGTILVLESENQTIASLSGGGSNGGDISLGLGTLTIDSATDSVFAGYISDTNNGKLVKRGTGTLTLTRANGYRGSTTIFAGVLALGCDNALPAAPLILSGGTLATNGFTYNKMSRGLTLSGDSAIDMDDMGGSTLRFPDSHLMPWSGTLAIDGWNGSMTGGGADGLFFGSSDSGLTSGQLNDIVFTNPNGHSGNYQARILATGEIVPVPEPKMVALSLSGGLLLGGLALRRWAYDRARQGGGWQEVA
jgi:autotransporter-associated beta strand protein